ncbi:hypothetical protein D3C77_420630 [compost metagenome]
MQVLAQVVGIHHDQNHRSNQADKAVQQGIERLAVERLQGVVKVAVPLIHAHAEPHAKQRQRNHCGQ